MDFRLEMQIMSPAGFGKGSLPIERPEGFSDEAYLQHATCAAELLRQVMNGNVDYRHNAMDGATTTMMIVDESVSEEVIEDVFRSERERQYQTCEWNRPHLIEPRATAGS